MTSSNRPPVPPESHRLRPAPGQGQIPVPRNPLFQPFSRQKQGAHQAASPFTPPQDHGDPPPMSAAPSNPNLHHHQAFLKQAILTAEASGSKPTLRPAPLKKSPGIQRLPFFTSMCLSFGTHIVAPYVLQCVILLVLMVMSVLFQVDLEDWLNPPKPKEPPVIEFVMLPRNDKPTPPPEKTTRMGEVNQQAGGQTPDEPQPVDPPQSSPEPVVQEQPKPTAVKPPDPVAKPSEPPKPAPKPEPKQPPKPTLKKQTFIPPTKPLIRQPVAPPPKKETPIGPEPLKPPSPVEKQTETAMVQPEQSTQRFPSAAQALAAAAQPSLVKTPPRAPEEDGPSQKKGVNVQESPDFGPYMAKLKRTLQQRWRPPRGKRPRRVVLRFDIGSEGTLSNLTVHQSSGTDEADAAAMAAVRSAAPFAALPASFRKESIPILFTFDYTIYGFKRR